MTKPIYKLHVNDKQEFVEVYSQLRYQSMIGGFSYAFSNPVGTNDIHVSGGSKKEIAIALDKVFDLTRFPSMPDVIFECLERVN